MPNYDASNWWSFLEGEDAAGARSVSTDMGRGSATATPGYHAGSATKSVQYKLTVGAYSGDLWIRIKQIFAIDPSDAEDEGIVSIDGSKIFVSHKQCSETKLGQHWQLLSVLGGGPSGWSHIKAIHTSDMQNITICFDNAFVADQNTTLGNDAPVKIATFAIDTYASQADMAAGQNKINQVDQTYDVTVPPNDIFFVPLYACPPKEKTTCHELKPIFSFNGDGPWGGSVDSKKYIWIACPSASLGGNAIIENPKEGDIVMGNFSRERGNSGGQCGQSQPASADECYLVGKPVAKKDMVEAKMIDVCDDYTPNLPTSPKSLKFYFTPETNTIATNCGSRNALYKAEGVNTLGPGDNFSIKSGADCDECAGSRDILFWDKKNNDVLRAMGFSCGFTGATFTDAVYRNKNAKLDAAGNVVVDPNNYTDVLYTTAISAAHDKQSLWGLPDRGSGTRVWRGAKAEITSPLDKKILFDKAQFWYSIESVVQHQWEISKLVRGVIRRSFGAGNEEKVFDGIDDDGNVVVRNAATGEILKENISVLSASQVELVATEMMTHTSSFQAGVKVDDLFHATFNMSLTKTETAATSSTGNETTESMSWAASAQMDMAGFGKWLSLDPDTALDDNGWEQWKDSISISFGFNGGSTSTVKATEFDLTANADGSITIDEDVNDPVTTVTESINADGSIFEFASANLTYSAEIFGGYNLSVTPPPLYQVQDGEGQWGTDCTDLSKWGYTLSGTLKDDIKWTIGFHGGKPSLAVATKIEILKSESESTASDKLIDWNDNSMYLNIGMNCVKGSGQGGAYEFLPSASVAGKVAGIEYNTNLVDGSAYLQKSWKENFTQKYQDWLNNEGDALEMNFNLRADFADGVPVTAGKFIGKADILFRKTIVDYNDVAGRLVFEVNAFAQITSGQNSAAVLAGKDAGFGATAGLKWENNILEWFGLPFNLHPSLKVGFAANYMFGGKTRSVSGQQSTKEGKKYKQKIIDSKDYTPGGSTTFVIGPITWDWKPVDTFKQELRRKHNSIFGGIGLGTCPLLGNIGSREEVWEYILRAGPFRAFGAIHRAQEICGGKRTQEFENVRAKVKAAIVKLEAATGSPWQSQGGRLPLCGVKQAVNNRKIKACKEATVSPRGSTDAGKITKIDDDKMNECWEAISGLPYSTLRIGIYNESLVSNVSMHQEPYPCRPTKRQLMRLLIDRMKVWDENFNHCACITSEFHKLSGDRYWGRATGVMKYDFAKWDDELQGDTTEMGVINRGFEIIDDEALSLVRQGKDPTDTKKPKGGISPAAEFADNITARINGIMDAVDLNAADKAKIKKQLAQTFGNKNSLVEWWTDEGICSVPVKFFMFVKDVVGWLYDGLGSLLGGDKALVDEITSAAYDASNPCVVKVTVPGTNTTPTTPPASDTCYKEWKKWRYYQESYDELLKYLNTRHAQGSTMAQYITSLHTLALIPSKAKPFPEYSSSGWSCGPCKNKKLSPWHDDSIIKSSNNQKDLLKAYQMLLGKNLSWASGATKSPDLAGTWPFSDMPYADFETSLKNLAEGPALGDSSSAASMYNANVFINGSSDGSVFGLVVKVIANENDGSDPNWHPCLRGHDENEFNDAEGKDYTPYINNFAEDMLQNEVCHDSNGGYGANPISRECDPETGAGDSQHYKSIFKADETKFQDAADLARLLGDAYTGLVGSKAVDYIKVIVNIIADPALAAHNTGPLRSDFWSGTWAGAHAAKWSDVYSKFVTLHNLVKSGQFTGGSPSGTDISIFTITLNAFDIAVGAIDISVIANAADRQFANGAVSQLKKYKEVFRVMLKHALAVKLANGNPVIKSMETLDRPTFTFRNGNPQATSAGVNNYAQWVYELLADSTYNLSFPTLEWILFSQSSAPIPTTSHANAAAVQSGWNASALKLIKGCYSAINRDGYFRKYDVNDASDDTLWKYAVNDVVNNSLSITNWKSDATKPQGTILRGNPIPGSWPIRNAAMMVFGKGLFLYPYGCSYHDKIHGLCGSGVTSNAKFFAWAIEAGYFLSKGQENKCKYPPFAAPVWWQKTGLVDGDGASCGIRNRNRLWSLYLMHDTPCS